MAMQERYDTAFLGILQHEGTIPPFLDAIFSFLYRRKSKIGQYRAENRKLQWEQQYNTKDFESYQKSCFEFPLKGNKLGQHYPGFSQDKALCTAHMKRHSHRLYVRISEKYTNMLMASRLQPKFNIFVDPQGHDSGGDMEFFNMVISQTDFFRLLKDTDGKMGFPPGVALNLVAKSFKKYEALAEKDSKEIARQQESKRNIAKEVVDMENVSPVVKEIEVETTTPCVSSTSMAPTHPKVSLPNSKMQADSGQQQTQTLSSHQAGERLLQQHTQQSTMASSKSDKSSKITSAEQKRLSKLPPRLAKMKAEEIKERKQARLDRDSKESDSGRSGLGGGEAPQSTKCDIKPAAVKTETEQKTETKDDASPSPSDTPSASKPPSKSRDPDKEDDDDPEMTKMQRMFQENAESYNGAVRDQYSWSQSITDVDIRVKVPSYIKTGKQVKVEIKRKHMTASCRTDSGGMEVIVEGELCWDIRPEESMWSLVPGEHIHVNLEKVQERWWDGIYKEEPKISVRKIDPSRPLTDMDDEAQAKIEEMMYNEHRKRLGLPQSHETKVHDMLKGAWNAKGSPFAGQPFDPSKVNVTAPGSMGDMSGMN